MVLGVRALMTSSKKQVVWGANSGLQEVHELRRLPSFRILHLAKAPHHEARMIGCEHSAGV